MVFICIWFIQKLIFFKYVQTDLFGQNIINYTHPEDQAILKRQLIPTNLEQLFNIPNDCGGGNSNDSSSTDSSRARTPDEEDVIDRKLQEDKRRFTVR